MPAERIVVQDAIVLRIYPSGERYTQVKLLSPERGIMSLLKRLRGSRGGAGLDLFDDCEASVDLKAGERHNEGFLQDFATTRKRGGIGRDYRLLQAAAWISGLFLSNPLHDENLQDSYELARKALDALDHGYPPLAIQLKTLFVFVKTEGYPIQEDWARKLAPELSDSVIQILNTPLDSIVLDPRQQDIALQSISHYVEFNTHVRLPAS